jgi:hypothetical protein
MDPTTQPSRSTLAKRPGQLFRSGHPTGRRLRKRCRARLHDVEIPHPFTIEAFCRNVARHQGRPLYLHPLPGPTGFCGLWIVKEVDGRLEDHVWYEPSTSAYHQLQIILHELSHLLWGHLLNAYDEILRVLFPDLDPAMVKGVLARARYSTEQEKEAETLADLIMEQVGRAQGEMTPEDPACEPDLHRLEEGFG